jgi:F-type H+-transporting ATPase subunit gamma
MSQAREIRTKITSVKNTQKITRAMELVAASKMRKAQERMATSKPYSQKIRQMIAHVAASRSEYPHEFLQQREIKSRVGYIVITTDRGLCGGLNVNLFRLLLKDMQRWQEQGVASDLCIIGRKAESYFKRLDNKVLAVATQLGDAPDVADLIGVVKIALDDYRAGNLDAVYIVTNDFVNTMVQMPQIRQLLPVQPDESDIGTHWDYIYEPDSARQILEVLLTRYIESQVYQGVIENIACEQSARMVAMKSATENAGDIIKELQLIYNKARQASITQEIAEIVGGADAIS